MKIIAEVENEKSECKDVMLQVDCAHEWQLKEILKSKFPHYQVKSAWRIVHNLKKGHVFQTQHQIF